MPKPDLDALAAALRENLKRRKEHMRSAQQRGDALSPVTSVADEGGDLQSSVDGKRVDGERVDSERADGEIEIGSKKRL
jgi:hypothetical protein